METQTLIALVGVSGALIGSAIGGLISFFSSRAVRRMEWELSLTEKDIRNRESLYADFLTETNRLMLQSIDEKITQGSELTTLIALEAKIWFFSDSVGAVARKIVVCVMDHHSKEPKNEKPSFPELKDKYIFHCKKDITEMKK